MTEFGDKIKEYMGTIEGNDITARAPVVKQERKRTTYGYTFDVSGIDFIAHKIVSGKETMTLVCFLSKQNEEGKPVCFIQEKGKNILVEEATLRSFLTGLTHVDDFPNKRVSVRDKEGHLCESVPVLHGDTATNMNKFIKAFLFMIDTPKFVDHIRMGLINLEIMYCSIIGGHDIKKPWFISSDCNPYYYTSMDYDSFVRAYTPEYTKVYNEEIHEFVDDTKNGYTYKYLCENNIHSKLFKAAIEYSSQATGCEKPATLMSFYTRTDEGNPAMKNLTMNIFQSFVVLANRYDEPFAIECMKNYFTNARLGNIDAGVLNQLFCIDISKYKQRRGHINNQLSDRRYYGSYDISTIHADLRLGPLPSNYKDDVIALDKRRMWDYIMGAAGKAFGKRLKEYVQYWADHMGTQLSYYSTIKDKYPEHLLEDHMILNEKYNEYQEFINSSFKDKKGDVHVNKNEALFKITADGAKYCEMTEGKWNFHILRQVEEFLEEASYMGNCLASSDYAGKVVSGSSGWVGVLRSNDDNKSLIDVEVDTKTGKMVQIFSRFDHHPILDGLWDEMKALKKIQDKIYKNMMDNGYHVTIEYDSKFDSVLAQKKKE